MNIEKYKIGQQVAICGFIEEINIEDLRDIENTTHLVINTLTRTIDVNPKYETVIIDPIPLGYEVEKDPRYKVIFKGLNINKHLCCNLTRENWYLWCEKESKMCHTSHTRKELEEAGFGWVFDCEGVEVEEVE